MRLVSFVNAFAELGVYTGDAETRKLVHTYTVGTGVNNQQVGIAYAPSGAIVSLSMSGDLNIFDDAESEKPTRVLSVRVVSISIESLLA